MAKKYNIYSKEQIQVLKDQLIDLVEELESFDMLNMEDRIRVKSTSTGGMIPSVISTIEDQVKTMISSVKSSIDIIISIYENEGHTEWLQQKIEIVVSRLNQIKDYYQNIRIKTLVDRIIVEEYGFTKKGTPKYITIVAATREKQIESKNSFTSMILKLLPEIDTITSYKKMKGRGGIEIPEIMQRFLNRKMTGE